MNNIEELVYSAMQSSLEGYATSVVDSIEFELKRELTADEHQQVYAAVDRAITGIEAAQKEIADWRSVAEAAAQDDADLHKLVDSKNDVISHLASGIINLKAAQKENANDNKLKYISRLEAEKQTEANTINLQRRMNLELMTENAGLKKRAKKAEAELSAAQQLNPVAVNVSELEATYIGDIRLHMAAISEWKRRAEVAEAELSAANEKLSKPVVLPERYSFEVCATPDPNGEWVAVDEIIEAIKAAGFKVEGE